MCTIVVFVISYLICFTFLVQRNKGNAYGVLFSELLKLWFIYEYFHGMVWIFVNDWISTMSLVIVLKRSPWFLSLIVCIIFMKTLKACGALAINIFPFYFISSTHLYWKITNFILRGSCPCKCRGRPDIKGLSNYWRHWFATYSIGPNHIFSWWQICLPTQL